MSKTFKSNCSPRTVEVFPASPRAVGIAFSDKIHNDIVIWSADAPALALATLEAAQGDNEACDANVHEAIVALRTYVVIREAAAKEAADREVLEAEALRLFATSIPFQNPSWSDLSHRQKQLWTAVAETARELHKAKS